MLATPDAPPAWVAPAPGDPLAAAQAAVKEKLFADAERRLLTYLAADADDEEARFLLARVVAWQGRYKEAIAEYDRLLKRSPKNGDYWLGKGQTLLWIPENAQAYLCFEQARRIAPHDPEAWRLAVTALARQGAPKREQALALQAQARKRFPKLTWALVEEPPAPPMKAPGPLEVELNGGADYLTNGYAPWTMGGLSGRYTFGRRTTAYGRVQETSRFGLLDTELMVGGTMPVGPITTGVLEASVSPTAQVLPRVSGTAMAELALGGGWVAWGRARHAVYTAANVSTATLGVEAYIGALRLTLAGGGSVSPAGGFPLGMQGAVAWMPNDRDAYSLRLGAGQEVETVGPGRIVTSDVLSASLEGRKWLTPHWALTAEAGWVRQGVFYDRLRGQLGVRRAF
jgi:YaiO family outer membrane protein